MDWGDAWDFAKDTYNTVSDVAGEVGDFVSENKDILSVGVAGASAYYGYQQQASAIEAQEAASARALSLQQKQLDMEAQAYRLTAPNEQAQIDLISSTKKIAGSVNDFLYQKSSAETESVGLGIPAYEKSLGLS